VLNVDIDLLVNTIFILIILGILYLGHAKHWAEFAFDKPISRQRYFLYFLPLFIISIFSLIANNYFLKGEAFTSWLGIVVIFLLNWPLSITGWVLTCLAFIRRFSSFKIPLWEAFVSILGLLVYEKIYLHFYPEPVDLIVIIFFVGLTLKNDDT
jgi:hypothetical protein